MKESVWLRRTAICEKLNAIYSTAAAAIGLLREE